MTSPEPPRLGRFLLRLFTPSELRQEIEGDLAEDFHRNLENLGPFRARLRYLAEAGSPSIILLRHRARGIDLAPRATVRATTGDPFMSAALRDLRYAFRILSRTPGFAAVVILSLALGIGPNTAMFSIVNGLFFRDRGIEDPATLVEIAELNRDGRHFQTYYSVYERVVEGTTDVFSGVAAYTFSAVRIAGDVDSAPAFAEVVSSNFFDVLGVRAAFGRTFSPEEGATPGTHAVAVLSDRLWRERFASDPGIVGGPVRINGRSYTIVGVADAAFRGKSVPGLETDLWLPIMMYPHLNPDQMSSGDLFISARVRPGAEPGAAVAAVRALATRIDEERADSRYTFRLGPYVASEYYFNPDFDGTITAMAALLLAVVGLVLLVACVNLAGFFLARSTDRQREMSIRVAMGAGRSAILRQLLVESLVLAAIGGIVGLGLGLFVVRVVTRIDMPLPLPVDLDLGLDLRVLSFTAAVTIGAGILFGLVPALRASRSPVAAVLRSEAGSVGGGRGKTRARSTMVAAQMALSMILLVGAGLFVRSFRAATKVDVGFDTGPAAILNIDAASSGYAPESRAALYRDVHREIEALPGVTTIGLTNRLPLALGTVNRGFEIPGVAPPENADFHTIELAYVTPGYFETIGIEVIRGRNFTETDDTTSAPVVIVSQAAADRFWPGLDPTGRLIHAPRNPDLAWSVVGVASNAKIWSLTEPPRNYFYFPTAQGASPGVANFVARGNGSTEALAREMAAAARRVDPDLFIVDARTMTQHLRYILFLPRTAALLVASCTALAVTLAAIGLYGIVSYSVSQRTKELGIRVALGAERARITRLVMKSGLKSVAFGATVGLLGAVVVARLVEGFLLGVSGWDPLTFLSVPLLLALVAGVAAYLPARRANRIDPIEAVRSD